MACHELFHIMYMKYILINDYSKRIVWFDEGMAQFLSGENDELLDIERFRNFYINVRKSTKVVPNLHDMVHGNSFYNENYNGYDLSYLCIRYLNEILNEDDFKELIIQIDKIEKYSENLLLNMFEYFDKRFIIK